MDALRYYQLLNTITLEEFAPDAYRFYGVLDGEMVDGIYVISHGIFPLSTEPKFDKNTTNIIEKVIQDKVEAQDKKMARLNRLKELEKKRHAAHADLRQARRDFKQSERLFETGAVSEEQRDRTHTVLVRANAQVETIDAEINVAKASIEE